VLLVAKSLQAFKEAGKALAQQLELLLEKGQVRYAPLGPDCLSTVYRHTDGELYLLLSTDCTTPEEQSVSLIRGLDVCMQQGNPARKPLLKDIEDEALIGFARAAADKIEQSLRCLVWLSSDDSREAMIAFMGSLFDLSGTDDPVIRKRLKAIGLSVDESRELGNRFQSVWTDLWVTYEQRGASRQNIISGILTGELHGAKTFLRELRWRLVKACAEELSTVEERLKEWKQSIASWADSLDAKVVKRCLFGVPDQTFEHNLDPYGKADGLSGLLGLLRKVYRKEQKTADYSGRLHEYACSLVQSSVRRQSADKKNVISLLTDVASDDSLKCLLELIEHFLITRLGTLKPARSSVSQEFPAEIDTQVHSYYSDCGGQSVARIVFEAYDRGLKAIAITDHQCFDGVEQALEIGDLFGVRVIPAVEFYAGIRRAGRVEQRRDVLVYFPDATRFLDWWKQGLDADTWQLFNDGWNRKLNGSKWGDVPIRRVTDWARAHGGVPVLAHPGLWSSERFHEEDWSFDAFEQLFRETGLAGIEISHSRLSFEENTKRFVPLVKQFNQQHAERSIVFTMGTDSHTSEGIGRANLTEEAIAYIARAFVPKGSAGPAVRAKIVNSLEDAARRIAANLPLYRLRDEVLRDAYSGFQACDRPLAVRRTDVDQPSDTILAGIKEYKGQPVIVAVNTGRREQFAGKDWGALDLAGAITIQNDSKAVYQFKDLITGAQYEHTGAELVANGLHVGLLPNATQFLSFS
jgi:histidinol phosphatase-like PHP family hydrolase